MDILVIEGDSRRRISVADRLAGCGHRVTLSSSIAEAEEILQFVPDQTLAPQAIVISERLLRIGRPDFRDEIMARFPEINWVPLPHDLDLSWLTDWIRKVADRSTAERTARVDRTALNVLIVESDDTLRTLMTLQLVSQADRVRSCSSVGQATGILEEMCAQGCPPHAIVSGVTLDDGNGISFFLSARESCPEVRWIVTAVAENRVDVRDFGITH